MSSREEYFARVIPLIGDGLRRQVVSASDLELTGRVLELLVSCMLERIVIRGDPAGLTPLRRYLRWKNGFVPVQWFVEGEHGGYSVEGGRASLPGPGPQQGGTSPPCHPGFTINSSANREAPDLHLQARISEAPGVTWDEGRKTVTMNVARDDPWSHLVVSAAAARGVRDLLLGRQGWPEGTDYWGDGHWPFTLSRTPSTAPEPCGRPPRGKHVMVIGCGSVGSEAVRLLRGEGLRWTLVDGGEVSVFNPYRQWFGTREIGQPKVDALARRLWPARAQVVRRSLCRDERLVLVGLLREHRPDLVILATGTGDHGWMGELLWRRGVAHLAACAYPQARFYEVSVVLPAEGTPCLGCFRGHLYRGAESSAPMSDELGSFLYEELDDEARRRAYVDLVAEPATALETSAIAGLTARCAVEALRPQANRGGWFERALASGTTCLLGGNVAEQAEDGQPAYGLTYPGQVVRLGLDDVIGTGRSRTCEVCGRRLEVVHRVELPEADGEDIDLGLLEPRRTG